MSTTTRGAGKIALAGIVLCTCLVVALAIATIWQRDVQQSKLDDVEAHVAVATSFQDAEAEGQAAGQALQQYVATGDSQLIATINEHTSAGVTKLTAAVQQSGVNSQPFLDSGSALVQAEGQIIALRQAGDAQGAITALTQLTTQFQEFISAQDAIIASEQASAQQAQNDADSAADAQTGLIVGAAIFALGAVALGVLYVRSTASRRRLGALPTS
ncbi:MAG TPA: hypothetical protein VMT90_04955 [Dehalococcoidia bacterium]|jgi:hypothetical protein|nr:hypothetical protein [Dehalococcoidia bacterium]